jgi:hypothetical protein
LFQLALIACLFILPESKSSLWHQIVDPLAGRASVVVLNKVVCHLALLEQVGGSLSMAVTYGMGKAFGANIA